MRNGSTRGVLSVRRSVSTLDEPSIRDGCRAEFAAFSSLHFLIVFFFVVLRDRPYVKIVYKGLTKAQQQTQQQNTQILF